MIRSGFFFFDLKFLFTTEQCTYNSTCYAISNTIINEHTHLIFFSLYRNARQLANTIYNGFFSDIMILRVYSHEWRPVQLGLLFYSTHLYDLLLEFECFSFSGATRSLLLKGATTNWNRSISRAGRRNNNNNNDKKRNLWDVTNGILLGVKLLFQQSVGEPIIENQVFVRFLH